MATSLNNLARLYTTLERDAEAEPLLHQAISVFYQRLGESHPDTQRTFQGFADLIVQTLQAGRSNE